MEHIKIMLLYAPLHVLVYLGYTAPFLYLCFVGFFGDFSRTPERWGNVAIWSYREAVRAVHNIVYIQMYPPKCIFSQRMETACYSFCHIVASNVQQVLCNQLSKPQNDDCMYQRLHIFFTMICTPGPYSACRDERHLKELADRRVDLQTWQTASGLSNVFNSRDEEAQHQLSRTGKGKTWTPW